MAQIKLNGDELMQYGKDIQTMSESFSTTLTEITNLVNQINDGWDGLAADSYAEIYNTTQTTLAQLPTAVSGIGETVCSIAQTWIDTEQALSQPNT